MDNALEKKRAERGLRLLLFGRHTITMVPLDDIIDESIVSDIDKNVNNILYCVAGERLVSWFGRRSGGWEAGGNWDGFCEIHVAEERV